MASGATITLTREPSGSRASQIGEDSSTRRPTWLDDPLAHVDELRVVTEADIGLDDLAGDLDEDAVAAVHHDVGDVVAGQERLQRPVAQDVVADVFQQRLLLGRRHHHLLGGDDLADDFADFRARPVDVHLRQLGYVNDFDQRAKQLTFQVIVFVGFSRVRRRAAAGGCMGGLRARRLCAGRLRGLVRKVERFAGRRPPR